MCSKETDCGGCIGGVRGLGKSQAELFAQSDAKVVIGDLDDPSSESIRNGWFKEYK